jgi:hypothetical protein
MFMHKQTVIEIVKYIFIYRGYSVGSSEICDLLAEKGNEHIFIKFENDPNSNNIRYFSNTVKRYGKGIVISESFDEKIQKFGLDDGLMLWDRGELETQIGRAVLGEALEKYEAKEPAKEVIVKDSIPKEYEKTIKVMLRSVPINIGKQDAFSIAEAKIGMPRSQALKFIPVWYYVYSFNIQKKYKSRIIDLSGAGEGFIHAITGEIFLNKYRDIKENAMMPTQNYEIKQPLIQKNDALSKTIQYIVREHTKEVRLNEMIGDTIIFENRMFAPDPAEIDLKMDILYIPVWELKGKREIIEINGYDGHIMAIKLYNDAEII